MKKNIFYAVLAMATLTITSCTKEKLVDDTIIDYVEIPDPKFETELINLGIDSDGIINQKILKSDAEAVEKLSLYSSGINTLAGIEGFVNLKRLDAAANNLITVNLSKNVLLDTINLGFNDLTSVSGLSKAKNLEWLSLSGNLFTEFTLDNPNVKNLLMSHNLMVSFDASKAPKLESALLTLNKIESLDFSANPLLKVLVFSANRVKTINLDENLNLEYIYCSNNLLTDFDLSMLPNLIDVRLDRNPTLTCIKVAAGQNIPTLKLSTYQQANENCN